MSDKDHINKIINTNQRYKLIKYILEHKNNCINDIEKNTKLSKGFISQYLNVLNSFEVIYYNTKGKTKIYNVNKAYTSILKEIVDKKNKNCEENNIKTFDEVNNKNIKSFDKIIDKYGAKTYKIQFKKYLKDYEIYELPDQQYWCISCQSKNCEHVEELKKLLDTL
ncbi:ArsR family transcriptional regulator [Methanococcus voltae]|nr:ArsR family transcriptional regulator [Methanococcus voltae]MCS3901902.1 DNA-binding transcriptional regulator GbsR (MarR family) [Methanococcus voltae]